MGRAAKQKFLRRQARKLVEQYTSAEVEVQQDQNGEKEEGLLYDSTLGIPDEQQENFFPSKQGGGIVLLSDRSILSQEKMYDPISLSLAQEGQVLSLNTSALLESTITSRESVPSVQQEIVVQKDENVLDTVLGETPLPASSQEEVPKQRMTNAWFDTVEGGLRAALKQMPSHHPNRGNVLHQLCMLLEKRGLIPQALEISKEVIQLLPARFNYVQFHQSLQKAMQSYSEIIDQVAEDERVKSLEILADQERQKREDIRREEESKKASQTVLPFPRKVATSHSSTPWQPPSSFTSSMTLAQRSGISKPLFNSQHEYRLYKVLLEIFPLSLVYPNMALQSIFYFKQMKALLDSVTFEYFLKAHVDICLIRPSDYYPIVAIELDSTLHDDDEAIRKDGLKDQIFHLGGVDLLRLRPLESYSDEELRREVIDLLEQWNQHSQRGVGSERNMMKPKDESL